MSNKNSRVLSGRKIALTAMFAAVSYGLSFLEFPIFPVAPYLKLDFSFSTQLIGAFMLGPVLGEAIVFIVQLLRLLVSSTGGVGEIANFVAATCFVFVPSLIYRFKKGLPAVFVALFIGTVLQIGASLLSNRFITFPLYMGGGAKKAFESAFWIIIAFNAVKCVANATITFLLYKRLKRLLLKEVSDRRSLTKKADCKIEDATIDFGEKMKRTGKEFSEYTLDFGGKLRKK